MGSQERAVVVHHLAAISARYAHPPVGAGLARAAGAGRPPELPILPPAELDQLRLTPYELRNQLYACRWGCRTIGFSTYRLESKGLWEPLVRVEGYTLVEGTEVPNFRHLHPSEVAILCGLSPQLDWGDDLRLALCAVGQLASPIQAGWIFGWAAHLLQVAVGADQVVEPADVLGRLLAVLRADAVDTWGSACGPDIAGSGGGPLGPVPAVLVGSADSPVSSPIGSQARPCVCRSFGQNIHHGVDDLPSAQWALEGRQIAGGGTHRRSFGHGEIPSGSQPAQPDPLEGPLSPGL